MRRLKFDWLMLLFTMVLSLAAALPALALDFSSELEPVILSGMYFTLPLIFSLIGMALAEYIHNKKYIIHRKGNRVVSFICAFVLSAIIGCGGEMLYALDFTRNTVEAEPAPITEPTAAPKQDDAVTNVSLLLDFSSSMRDFLSADGDKTEICKSAACELIDELGDDTAMQYIAFTSVVYECTDITTLDQAGKRSLKAAINRTDHIGTTDFNAALETAYNTLSGSDAKKKAVILMTDGDSEVSDSIRKTYKEEGIPVYVISIDTEESVENPEMRGEIIEFAESTGGFETQLDKDSFNPDNLLEALREAYEDDGVNDPNDNQKRERIGSKHGPLRIKTGDGYLPYGYDDLNLWKIIVRLVMFILYGMIASWVMYRSVSRRMLLGSLISGAVTTLAATTIGGIGNIGAFISTCIFCIVFWCAFTVYYPSRGEDDNVQ